MVVNHSDSFASLQHALRKADSMSTVAVLRTKFPAKLATRSLSISIRMDANGTRELVARPTMSLRMGQMSLLSLATLGQTQDQSLL